MRPGPAKDPDQLSRPTRLTPTWTKVMDRLSLLGIANFAARLLPLTDRSRCAGWDRPPGGSADTTDATWAGFPVPLAGASDGQCENQYCVGQGIRDPASSNCGPPWSA